MGIYGPYDHNGLWRDFIEISDERSIKYSPIPIPNYPEDLNRLLGNLGCTNISKNKEKWVIDEKVFEHLDQKYSDLYPVLETAFNLNFSLTFYPAHDYADALVCEQFEGLPDWLKFSQEDWDWFKNIGVDYLLNELSPDYLHLSA